MKADEDVLSGGPVGIGKIRLLAFTPDTEVYYGIGSRIGQAFSVSRSV